MDRVVHSAGAHAFALSNAYAPEHLILALREPRAWLPRVEAAGSVFLGDFTPEALGDYCSGTNHVLPTGGCACHSSGLSVQSFLRGIHVVDYSRDALLEVSRAVVTLAEAEDLPGLEPLTPGPTISEIR